MRKFLRNLLLKPFEIKGSVKRDGIYISLRNLAESKEVARQVKAIRKV